MDLKYRVRFYIGDQYQVFEKDVENFDKKKKYHDDDETDEWVPVFQGTLGDCESFIRLRENEIVDF